MPKPKEFTDTNEAGRKYKGKPKRGAKTPTGRKTTRRSSDSRAHIPDTEKIRKDLANYRKRVLQAPGRAVRGD